MDAVQSLFRADQADCVWLQEPGRIRWTFFRKDSQVAIDVRWLDWPEMFVGDDDLLHFALEVDRELDALHSSWGEDGYLAEWRHPFPLEAQRKLKLAIQRAQTPIH